jgi:hypothetical protein
MPSGVARAIAVPRAPPPWREARRVLITARWQDERVQRIALVILFSAIALSLGALALWAALSGGRAWIVALTAGALALWMGDLARRAIPTRRE